MGIGAVGSAPESGEEREGRAGDRRVPVVDGGATRVEPVYLSPLAAARLVGIGRSKLYELVHEPGFPAYKLDAAGQRGHANGRTCARRTLIPRAEFLAWFERRLRRVGGGGA